MSDNPTQADPPETLEIAAKIRARVAELKYEGWSDTWFGWSTTDALRVAGQLEHQAAEITRLTKQLRAAQNLAEAARKDADYWRDRAHAAERREHAAFEAGWHDGIDYGCGDQTYADVNARFTAYQAHAQEPTP